MQMIGTFPKHMLDDVLLDGGNAFLVTQAILHRCARYGNLGKHNRSCINVLRTHHKVLWWTQLKICRNRMLTAQWLQLHQLQFDSRIGLWPIYSLINCLEPCKNIQWAVKQNKICQADLSGHDASTCCALTENHSSWSD